MTPDELRKEFEKETGKRYFVAPVSHGEYAFLSWEAQAWLETRCLTLIAERDKAANELAIEFAEWLRNMPLLEILHGHWVIEGQITTKELFKFFQKDKLNSPKRMSPEDFAFSEKILGGSERRKVREG